MTTNAQPGNASTAIISVDLVRAAKRSDTFPKDWSDEKMTTELRRYEKFLRLAALYPNQPISPTKSIDEFWHLHMLHPVAYVRDCTALLGFVLDHDGGFGKSPDEVPILDQTFRRTSKTWESTYGEPYLTAAEAAEGATNCWHDCQSRCHHACKSATPAEA